MSKIIKTKSFSFTIDQHKKYIDYDHYFNDIKRYKFNFNRDTRILLVKIEDVSESDKSHYMENKLEIFKQCEFIKTDEFKELYKNANKDISTFYKNGLLHGYHYIAPINNYFKYNKLTNTYCYDYNCKYNISLFISTWNILLINYMKKKGYDI